MSNQATAMVNKLHMSCCSNCINCAGKFPLSSLAYTMYNAHKLLFKVGIYDKLDVKLAVRTVHGTPHTAHLAFHVITIM